MAKKNTKETSKEEPQTETRTTIAIAAVIVIAFACVYYFARVRGTTRYDAFASCLTAKQVKMYGLYWCTHCAEQKEMFGASFKRVTYIECGIKGSKDEEQVCKEAGVKNFPTWQFPDGSRKEGTQPLQLLSERTGCSLP
jgi:hypothetical protein